MRYEITDKHRPLMPVELICQMDGLPMPEPEHRFDAERKWRFDYGWVDRKVALEIEGGVFTRGRHVRGTGYLRDLEKYNRATALGWKVFRCTPTTIHLGMQFVKTALCGGADVTRGSGEARR